MLMAGIKINELVCRSYCPNTAIILVQSGEKITELSDINIKLTTKGFAYYLSRGYEQGLLW